MPTILCNYANEIIYRVPQGVHTYTCVFVLVCVCVAKRAFKLINLTYTANYANYIEEVKLKTKLRLLHFVAATSGNWLVAGAITSFCVCVCVCKA